MKLFNISGDRLVITTTAALIENNVDELFELEFVKSELRINNFRFDTLCFDSSNNSFVVIEYKKGHSYSVIIRVTHTFHLLIIRTSFSYNETLGKTMKMTSRSSSFQSFSLYQKTSVNFKNLPFELWEVTRYKNGSLAMNHISTESDVDGAC